MSWLRKTDRVGNYLHYVHLYTRDYLGNMENVLNTCKMFREIIQWWHLGVLSHWSFFPCSSLPSSHGESVDCLSQHGLPLNLHEIFKYIMFAMGSSIARELCSYDLAARYRMSNSYWELDLAQASCGNLLFLPIFSIYYDEIIFINHKNTRGIIKLIGRL